MKQGSRWHVGHEKSNLLLVALSLAGRSSQRGKLGSGEPPGFAAAEAAQQDRSQGDAPQP